MICHIFWSPSQSDHMIIHFGNSGLDNDYSVNSKGSNPQINQVSMKVLPKCMKMPEKTQILPHGVRLSLVSTFKTLLLMSSLSLHVIPSAILVEAILGTAITSISLLVSINLLVLISILFVWLLSSQWNLLLLPVQKDQGWRQVMYNWETEMRLLQNKDY